jgi:TIR domain
MKVFISWSGSVSHRVAVTLRDWLPSVIQSIQPYVSSEDIDKGARWSSDIAGELHESTYGLICLTKDNINAPWINFEAGALGKSIDKARVSPFLFRIKRSEVEGPILQFQSTIFEKEDVLKLLKSVNDACGTDGLEDSRLERSFEVWWPELERQLNEVPQEQPPQEQASETPAPMPSEEISRVLEEVLELTRNNHKLLRSPEAILPPDYIMHLLHRPRREDASPEVRGFEGHIDPGALREAMEVYRDVLKFMSAVKSDLDQYPAYAELLRLIRRLDGPLRYIARSMNLKLPREALVENEEF